MLTLADKKYLHTTFVTKDEFQEVKTILVQVLSEVQAMRDDKTVSDYRQSEHSDQLEQHDRRIGVLEHHAGIATG